MKNQTYKPLRFGLNMFVLAWSCLALPFSSGCGKESPPEAKTSQTAPQPVTAGVSVTARPAGSLVIRKAIYGYLPDGPTVDVTDKVRLMVKSSTLSVVVNDNNFGDPSNGSMKLKIIKAIIKFQGSYPGDVTDTIKGFQTGNSLHTTGDNGAKITVDYEYGDGKRRSIQTSADGSLSINPPTKLHIDYTINGMDNCKSVDYAQTLEISDKVETSSNDTKSFLGSWTAKWSDVTEDITIQIQDGKPKVQTSGASVFGEKLECGKLSFNLTVTSSHYEFLYVLTPNSKGLALDIFRLSDGGKFTGMLTR